MPELVDRIAGELDAVGMIVRGGFGLAPDESRSFNQAGARAVLLVGHHGSAIWPHFERWLERQPWRAVDPLDTWSREVIGRIATGSGARAVSPSDRPYLPFQQWAMRAEGLKPSPLGILMHPEFGLWHAYRGAILFDDEEKATEVAAAFARRPAPVHLCDGCAEKPCLGSCPVRAHGAAGFDYGRCLAHVRSTEGATCMAGGCLDRNACPHATAYRYSLEQQAFHMRAFVPQ